MFVMAIGDMFSKMFKKEEKEFNENTYKDKDHPKENLKVDKTSSQVNNSNENVENKLIGSDEVKQSPKPEDTPSESEQVTKE